MEKIAKRQSGRVLVAFLLLVILALLALVAWKQDFIFNSASDTNLSNQPNHLAKPKTYFKEDDILSVKIKQVTFWEAQVEVEYQHKTGRKNGYLGAYGDYRGASVGLKTSTGKRSGVALFNRKYNTPGSHSTKSVRTRMYDPYRSDYNFAEKNFELEVKFPSVESLKQPEEQVKNRYHKTQVVIYRNVPKYNDFAERLYLEGFSAERISMHLAVCKKCKGSVVFGDGVTVAQVQSVLMAMKDHGFSFDAIYFDDSPNSKYTIDIGNTPPKGARPYLEKFDQLVSQNITEKEFFDLLGFAFKTPRQKAEGLVADAKWRIIQKQELSKARLYLEDAVELDDAYIPAYLEMAKLVLADNNFEEKNIVSQMKQYLSQAKQIVESAIMIQPDFSESYVLLGYLEAALGNYAEAESSLVKAEDLDDNSLWIMHHRGLIAFYQKDYELAKKEYRKVLEFGRLDSDNDIAHRKILFELAQLYSKDGLTEEALNIYRRSYKLFNLNYRMNSKYLLLAIAEGVDALATEKLLSYYKSKRWNIAFQAIAMNNLMKAASELPDNKSTAVKLVLRAQTSNHHFPQVVGSLLLGEAGRQTIQKLFEYGLLEMSAIEKSGSVLSTIIHEYNMESIFFALRYGANPNLMNESQLYSPLMMAVALNRDDQVKAFMDYGGDPYLKNSVGVSAISIANELALKDMQKILIMDDSNT